MITTNTADSVLKTYYLPAICDQLNKSVSPFFARIKQTTADVVGRDIKKLVRHGLDGGVVAGSETGDLPAAGANRYSTFTGTLRNLYGTIEITDKILRAASNTEGAFVNILEDEMNGLLESATFNFSRMLFGDGSGLLATILSAEGTTFTVDSVRNLVEGMSVDVYNTSGYSAAGARTVEKVDHINKKITLSGASIATPTNFTLYAHNSKGLELTGLGAIFNTEQSIYGVQRNPWNTPVVMTEVGDITEMKIQTAIDEIEEHTGSKVNFIICSWGVRRALFKALADMRTLEPMVLEGGFKALNFNGIPVVADRFCPEGTMYLLNTDDFGIHQLCDWQWLEGEDGKVLRQMSGKPVYTATLVKYADLMCYRPAGQAMLTGITEA